jgi:murein DD-endopeptidase MepM/ murein hydrolase activator NlpD
MEKQSSLFQMILSLIVFVSFLALFILPQAATAQEEQSSGPVYIVQEYDTLWEIARRFRLTVEQLAAANQLSDPGQIRVGDKLFIPGLEGISGTLITVTVPYGETVRSLGRRYQVSEETLNRLNELVSPKQVHVGFHLIIPEDSSREDPSQRISLKPGQSTLELGLIHGINPYHLANGNFIPRPSAAVPHDIFFLEGEGRDGPGALPERIQSILVDPPTFTQGKTVAVQVETDGVLSLSGSLVGNELKFFEGEPGKYYALQGVHAMQAPGSYPVEIEIHDEEGVFRFSQMVYLRAGGYPQAPDLKVDESGLDLALTQPEDARWMALAGPGTPERYWEGYFQFPSPRIYLGQYTSRFGERRTYNNNPQVFYHTGLDIPGQTGTDVYAPAPGIVVFAEHLDVRGHSMIINHGWGVYTAFMHLSEYKVSKGDWVEVGQVVALVGNTGLRTTGSHLHWEVIVGGVQVDPMEWMERIFP